MNKNYLAKGDSGSITARPENRAGSPIIEGGERFGVVSMLPALA